MTEWNLTQSVTVSFLPLHDSIRLGSSLLVQHCVGEPPSQAGPSVSTSQLSVPNHRASLTTDISDSPKLLPWTQSPAGHAELKFSLP